MSPGMYDFSLRVADTKVPTGTMLLLLTGAAFLGGLMLMWISPLIIYGIAGFGIITAFCLRWPYGGLILYILLEYLRPMERYPVLSPLHLTRIVAVLALIGWLYRRRRDGLGIWVHGPETTAIFLFLLVAFASVPFATWRSHAIETAADITRTVIICLLIINLVNTPKRLAGFMFTFLAINVYLSGEQLYYYYTLGTPIAGQLLRVGSLSGSFLGEDGDFAMAMSIAMPFAFYLMWTRIKPILRVLCGIAVAMFVASIIATGSRGGSLGFLALLIVLPIRSQKRALTAGVIATLFIIAWISAPTAYKQRMSTIGSSGGFVDVTAEARKTSWNAARRMYQDRPLLGVGVGNFYDTFATRYGGTYQVNRTVHSIYWQAASEMGTLGILVFVLVVGVTLLRSASLHSRLTRHRLGGTPIAAYSAAMLPALAAFLVTGAFQTPLYYIHMFLLAALTLSLNNIIHSKLGDDVKTEVHDKWNRRPMEREWVKT